LGHSDTTQIKVLEIANIAWEKTPKSTPGFTRVKLSRVDLENEIVTYDVKVIQPGKMLVADTDCEVVSIRDAVESR